LNFIFKNFGDSGRVTFWGEGAPLSAVLTLLYLYYPVLDTLMEVGSGLGLPVGLKV